MPGDAGSPFRDPDDEKFRPVARPVPVAPPVPGARRRRSVRRYRFQMGEAIARTFVVWFRNFVPFSVLAFVLYVPSMLFGVWFLGGGGARSMSLVTYTVIAKLFTMFTNQLLAAVVIWGVVERLRGRSPSILICFARGLARIGPVLIVALAVLLPFAAVAFGAVFVLASMSTLPSLGQLFLLLLFLAPPALIWMTMVYVSTPAVVVERPRFLGLGAIGRSFRLTARRRWPVFGSIFTIWLVVFFSWMFIGLVTFTVGLRAGSQLPGFFLQNGLTILVEPLSATLPAVVYYQLRREKEGIDVEEIASVFD